MPLWQIALVALVTAWALQAVGTYFQMCHYRSTMSEVSRRWVDGYVGAGSAKSTLGRGVILLLVVGPDQIVRSLCVMEGRSVFAKFKTMTIVEGLSLDALRTRSPFRDPGRTKALGSAIKLIEKAAQRRAAEDMAAAA